MNCKSRITGQQSGSASMVHCRPCNLRRRLHEAEVFVCPSGHQVHCGPGCQLQRTLGWFGLKDDGTCHCKAYAAQMDAWGPDQCIRRIEEIVQHLREAAAKRGLPFLATAARIAIGRAVEAARQEMSHGQEAVSEARETNVGRSE